MRRKWLRLIAWISLGTFLANTPAAVHWINALLIGHEMQPHDCGQQHSPVKTLAEHRNRLCRSGCPDCPKSPFAPKCPCPGGCALCNVAKVPCHLPPYDLTGPTAACPDDAVAEIVFSYTPPAGRLIRPPRA